MNYEIVGAFNVGKHISEAKKTQNFKFAYIWCSQGNLCEGKSFGNKCTNFFTPQRQRSENLSIARLYNNFLILFLFLVCSARQRHTNYRLGKCLMRVLLYTAVPEIVHSGDVDTFGWSGHCCWHNLLAKSQCGVRKHKMKWRKIKCYNLLN
jgi:hypothetical protein